MTPASFSAAIPLMAVAALLSAALTWSSIRYAMRVRLIDEPGRRRSHSVPTPRGGGIAIVAAIALCVGVPLAVWSPPQLFVIAALLLVAAVGWIDDHRPLSARLRILVHWGAVLLLFVPSLFDPTLPPGTIRSTAWGYGGAFLVIGLIVVWSVNLHNFMDGIDGLLAMQALFCLGAFAALLAQAGDVGPACAAGLAAAAVLGFLPFNFPRARIFMGDVGSGALGLTIGLAAIALAGHDWGAAATAVVVVSAFVTDATCTLLSRMLRGRRWYSAHREHLYQWLVRSGFSHAQVVALYMTWNLLLVLPVVCWMNRPSAPSIAPGAAVAAAAAVYASATAAWWFGKRWCLGAARTRRRHAAA
jgi:UDP-N-acetylmuramyl pentapeptide phosphotransferase/UDP-N-acetylglucosamine-1-phosphate transferase